MIFDVSTIVSLRIFDKVEFFYSMKLEKYGHDIFEIFRRNVYLPISQLQIWLCFHFTLQLAVLCMRNRFAKIFTKFPPWNILIGHLNSKGSREKLMRMNVWAIFLLYLTKIRSQEKGISFFFIWFNSTKNNWSIFCLLDWKGRQL